MEDGLKVLAIDPATNCGWAHSCGTHGLLDLSKNKDESPGMRLARLWTFLQGMLESPGIDAIGFESSQNVRGNGIKLQSRLEGVIILFAETRGVPYRAYNPSELKKLSTGSGNAGKEDMVARALEIRPSAAKKGISHDEADAICIMAALEGELGGVPKEVFKNP